MISLLVQEGRLQNIYDICVMCGWSSRSPNEKARSIPSEYKSEEYVYLKDPLNSSFLPLAAFSQFTNNLLLEEEQVYIVIYIYRPNSLFTIVLLQSVKCYIDKTEK